MQPRLRTVEMTPGHLYSREKAREREKRLVAKEQANTITTLMLIFCLSVSFLLLVYYVKITPLPSKPVTITGQKIAIFASGDYPEQDWRMIDRCLKKLNPDISEKDTYLNPGTYICPSLEAMTPIQRIFYQKLWWLFL